MTSRGEPKGAYEFESDAQIEQMKDQLDARGPWQWQLRDSDAEGAYLRALPDESYTRVRILGQPPRYTIEVVWDYSYDGPGQTTREEIDRIIREDLAPAIGAKILHESS